MTVPMRDQAQVLAAAAEDALEVIWESYQDGDLSEDEFIEQAAAALAAMMDQAAAYADASLANILDEAPVGVLPADPTGRLGLAMATLLRRSRTEPGYDAGQQIRLIGRAEMHVTVQDTTADVLQARRVPGWHRVAQPTACTACRNLAVRKFIPSTIRMWSHTGCSCLQEPVRAAPAAEVDTQ